MSLFERFDSIILQLLYTSKDVELAYYLIEHIRGIQKDKEEQLDIIVSPNEYHHHEYKRPLLLLGGNRYI